MRTSRIYGIADDPISRLVIMMDEVASGASTVTALLRGQAS